MFICLSDVSEYSNRICLVNGTTCLTPYIIMWIRPWCVQCSRSRSIPDGHLVKAKAAIIVGPSILMISSWNVVIPVVLPVGLNQTKLLFNIYIYI